MGHYMGSKMKIAFGIFPSLMLIIVCIALLLNFERPFFSMSRLHSFICEYNTIPEIFYVLKKVQEGRVKFLQNCGSDKH